jgi:two-component system KDP operon response regulator KdpE
MEDISNVPIIMLTGQKNTEQDVVSGLEYGADEYLLKPVGTRDLVARVRAALRRAESPIHGHKKAVNYSDGYLDINLEERKVMVKGERMKLTPYELRLLALLLDNAGTVLTHKQILEKVWGWEYIDDVDYVRVYISHLRQKIELDLMSPRYILNEPGTGYYFREISQN